MRSSPTARHWQLVANGGVPMVAHMRTNKPREEQETAWAATRGRTKQSKGTLWGPGPGQGLRCPPPLRLVAMVKPALLSSPAGTSLSKDELYAPLSKSDESAGHSLSLRTSLRESALITFLSSTSESLKSSNEREFDLYQRIGGSIAQHGAGAGERANRNALESKLQNRTLILVGGGIQTTGVVNNCNNESGCLKSGTAHVNIQSRRKRTRGRGGIFGSVSNKKRKKLIRLANVVDDDTGRKRLAKGVCMAKSYDANIGPDVANDVGLNMKGPGRVQSKSGDLKETTKEAIKHINMTWTEYFRKLTASLDDGGKVERDSSALDNNRRLSMMLATSEKIGMAVTIIECPSRQNLVERRGVVVNETVEMWKIAFWNRTSKTEEERHAGSSWAFVRVPKRGTVFRVDVVSSSGFANSMILQY